MSSLSIIFLVSLLWDCHLGRILAAINRGDIMRSIATAFLFLLFCVSGVAVAANS